MLGLQNEREWVSFCDKVLQQPGARDAIARFTGNAKRVAERDALRAIIVETFAAADRRRRWSSGSRRRRSPMRGSTRCRRSGRIRS